MPRLSIPTTARLPSSLRVDPTNPAVHKILGRLSRPSLLSVVLDWLHEDNLHLAMPFLRRPYQGEDYYDEDEPSDDEDDEFADDFYPPARSPAALRELYISLQARKGSKREVLDRILDGDWRHGLTLYQLAMADLQYMHDHPTSQRWAAYKVVPLKLQQDQDGEQQLKADNESLSIPRFHPSTFLRNLQAQVLPDVKAHYTFEPHRTLPVLLLRIFVIDSPYNTSLSLQHGGMSATTFDSSRTIYIAFPHAAPYVYLSSPQATTVDPIQKPGPGPGVGESKSLVSLLLEGLPKALSRPLQRQRVTLQSTGLITRNLEELVERRGPGRTNFAGGGWSWYADEMKGRDQKRETPLDLVLPSPPDSEDVEGADEQREGREKRIKIKAPLEEQEEEARRRAKRVAQARFGNTAKMRDGKGVERVDVVIDDPFPQGDGDENEEWRPKVRLTFHGPHVFAGIRQLIECGIVDGERMPGWMTGEEGVTIGAVRHGRIRGHKGSGV
ncbi:uncharacterized protein CTHT_0007050 [Thermochaetoides thermophila DSM 1495]|uniref:Uncharacterized protein n=1 Tax=Chaetomium thermophilum (strain DSM 1495 / CBS 144.50 / IMI 039719) TaxID=759272 RepID=G0RYK8_CHATD|nr:hypothetical protein CTHT_0007050 [Thermochaetoides thermophila DSM 1495]EGS23994.1 hypothetical protein CTHT_0007050 [Thermochaetoides thermophila DSM 1495]